MNAVLKHGAGNDSSEVEILLGDIFRRISLHADQIASSVGEGMNSQMIHLFVELLDQ